MKLQLIKDKKMLSSSLVLLTVFLFQTSTAEFTVPGNCGWSRETQLESDGETVVLSPENGLDIGDAGTCQTTVIVGGHLSRHLEIEVDKFDLNGPSGIDSECIYGTERLTFAMGRSCDADLMNMTWCGDLYAEKHVFPTDMLNITYNSGNFGRGTGFSIRVSAVLTKTRDIGPLQAREQPRLLYSYDYPKHYDVRMSESFSLNRKSGHFLVIRILMLDIEDVFSCVYDKLTIDGEDYCGRIYSQKTLVFTKPEVDISFTSDAGKSYNGYILEYASYPAAKLFDTRSTPVIVGESLQLFGVATRGTWDFSTSTSGHSLHFEFLTKPPVWTLHAVVREQSRNHSIKELKHYWSKDEDVTLDISQMFVNDVIYFLVKSVPGHGDGIFKAENTVAWLKGDHNDATLRLYRPEVSSVNIRVKLDDETLVNRGLTVHNGPDTSYFDLTKGCTRTASHNVVSFRSNIVTVDINSELWQEGFWISYSETDEISDPEMFKGRQRNILMNEPWLKQRNMFCVLKARDSTDQTAVEVEARTNLGAPYMFILEDVRPHTLQKETTSVIDLEDPAVKMIFSTSEVTIKVWVPQPPPSDQTAAEMYLAVTPSSVTRYENQPYLSPESHEQTVNAPSVLIIGPRLECHWIINTDGWEGRDGMVKVTLNGVTIAPSTEDCGAQIELLLGNAALQVFALCGGKHGGHQKSLSVRMPMTVRLVRERWVDLPEPLFTYVRDSEGEIKWCPPSVTLDDGQEFTLSSSTIPLILDGYQFSECEMRIQPKYYDSEIYVRVENWHAFNVEIFITGFDPADPTETPLKEVEVRRASLRGYVFHHMAVKLRARIPSFGYSEVFRILFRLQREVGCDSVGHLYADATPQYIVSPNYPQPYDEHVNCVWHISAQMPLHLELVDLDIRDDNVCGKDRIIFSDGYSSDRYATTLCGSGKNQNVSHTGITKSGYCCQVTVRFATYAASWGQTHRGFMLRYSTRAHGPDEDIGYGGGGSGRSSSGNNTGVAVGAAIASILFVVMILAGLALFINYRRKNQRLQRQQRVRRNLRNAGGRNGNTETSTENGTGNNTSSVFIVGPMIFNTSAPPPPYPGLPERARDGQENFSLGGYYTNPDGGYTDSSGQFVAARGSLDGSSGGNGPAYQNSSSRDYVDLEEPPPYHPLMPGSPIGTDEHLYHPLSGTRDSGIGDVGRSNSTLYSVAHSTTSNPHSTDDEMEEQSGRARTASVQFSRADGERGRTGSMSEPHYASLNDEEGAYTTTRDESPTPQDPPPYEAVNPPHPPPAYEVAMQPNESTGGSGARETGRGNQHRNGRLGPL